MDDTEVRLLIQTANELIRETFESRNHSKIEKNISVFTSNYTAPCLIMALSKTPDCSDGYKRLERCAKYVVNQMPDEALYGRVGYLTGILALLNSEHSVSETIVSKVIV